MAKDPAFLFYSSDFLIGTYEMTDAQVGQYIRLLCLQHAKGHLSESLMTNAMGGKFDETVACKFLVDENRLYYNERLDQEVNRRKEYSNSRRNNRNKATPDNLSIYLIKNDDDGLVKIGSSNNPERRILELKAQMKTKNLRLLAIMDGVSQDIERELHTKYTNLLAFNEWYRLNDMTVNEIIADYDMKNHMIAHMETETETITTNNTTNLDKNVPKKGVIGGNKTALENRFNDLWALYPRKQGRADALKSYEKAVKAGVTDEVIKQGIENYVKHIAANKTDPQYVKQGSTFFSKQAWADDYTIDRRDNGTGRTAGNHDRPGAGPDAGAGNISEYANLPAIRC
jgi:hypothetical protein